MKNIVRKTFFTLLSFFIVLIFFSCNEKSSSEPATNLVLALRSGTYADVVKFCLPKFEEENNVKCKVLELEQEDLRDGVGNCDLCMVDSQWVASFMSRNELADLKTLGYKFDPDIIPATTTICYNGNGLYLVPYYGNVTVLLYNKLLAKEAGFAAGEISSITDMLAVCQFANKRHTLGFLYRGDTNFNIVTDFLPILLAYGGWLIDENKRPTVNTPEFLSALYMYKELISTGRVAKKSDLIAAIENKAAAMTIGWPGWYTPKRNSSMEYIALTGKVTHLSDPHASNIYGTWLLGIPESSQHKELAIKLLTYLMDPKVQKSTVSAGGVPCRYSCLRDNGILGKYPEYKFVCDALENGVYRPVIEEWPEFCDILGSEMKLALDGDKSVEDVLLSAQEKLERRLSLSGENAKAAMRAKASKK